MQILQPPNWPLPRGYSNGILTQGELIFVGGQIGWDDKGSFPGSNFTDQVKQALINTLAILEQGGAKAEHIVRMTWFITNKEEYLGSLSAVGEAYREIMGKHYPVMSIVQVVALLENEAKVEIESTAVIPQKSN